MAAPDRVILVDGHNLIFRAYFALPGNLRTSGGLHTNAVLGFAMMFRKLQAGRRARYGAVVFDPPGPTTRDELYEDYKAGREAMADDLVEQLPWIDRVVEAHGFPLLRVAGVEADDVIGTLARQALEAGCEVRIVSTDKDFAQLVGPRLRMVDTLRDVTYDPEQVRKKWGVPPEQFRDYLALVGDKVDNIPGVPGVGAKGAAKLLERFGDLATILARAGELKGRQRTSLTEHREQALLSQRLATIDQQIELGTTLADLELPEPEPAALNALYRELELYSLLSVDGEAPAGEEGAEDERDFAAARTPEDLACVLQAPGALAALPVTDDEEGARRLAGLALAAAGGPARWVPLAGAHASAPLDDPTWAELRAALADPGRPKLVHDAKELQRLLADAGAALEGVELDTALASFLVDPTRLLPHRLGQLAKEHLQRPLPDRKTVCGAGKKARPFAGAPLAEATAFACERADALARIAGPLAGRLDEAGLAEHLRQVDLPLARALCRMERRGLRVDVPLLEAQGAELRAELARVEAAIFELAGRRFNLGSPKQLGGVLFEEQGLPAHKKTKTGYSTAADALQRLAKDHELPRRVLEHRELAKLISTYVDVLLRAVDRGSSRVHTTFLQTTSATGRIGTADPDLQRTPVRTERGARIREAFVAPEGWRLVSADWSQIELRLLAHFAGDPRLVDAFREGRDVHRATAAELFGVAPDEVTADQRRVGKTVNFATIYGQGATALGQILDVPRKEAKRYIERFFATYAGVRAWLDRTVEEAAERGYVTTLLGRRRYLPELSSANAMIYQAGVRIAANTPIQGSAADVCKLALLELDRRLPEVAPQAGLVLQVHDELLVEAPAEQADAAAALAREVMEGVVDLAVPLLASVGVGRSWAEAH